MPCEPTDTSLSFILMATMVGLVARGAAPLNAARPR
jgi:hypothetical protein